MTRAPTRSQSESAKDMAFVYAAEMARWHHPPIAVSAANEGRNVAAARA
jgi:hypothetical protein